MTSAPPCDTTAPDKSRGTTRRSPRRDAATPSPEPGTGYRAWMYIDAILGAHAEVAELVAWCEPNPGRMDYYDELVTEAVARPGAGRAGGSPLPRYGPDQLEKMIVDARVDVVVVTSPDHTHADIVSWVLAAGADAVVEKPLTIDAAGCRAITYAVASTGRDAIMTFNYRYAPRNSSLKQVIASGEIGTVTSVHFEWALDSVHGADYFLRWHREKKNSGGLLIHKSSHHFDLVNWWLADAPVLVYASGALRFDGADAAAARGIGPRPERGTGHPDDPWALDLTADPRLERLYLDAERYDGYLRDRDVFAPGSTIADTMAVLVDYRGGATLSYSLNAHSPWEGYKVTVRGTAGRAELEVVERGSVEFDEQGRSILDPSATPEAWAGDTLRPFGDRLLVQKHWERATSFPIPVGVGGHGGGDAILIADVFRGPGEDPLGRPAGYVDGVRAVAVGIAANQSMVTGQAVQIADLGLGVEL